MRQKKILENLLQLARSPYSIFILIRAFSIIASLSILRIILDQFSLLDFAQVQKQFGLISILFWFADFGMLNYAIILFSENKSKHDLREVLSTRFWTILICSSVYFAFQYFLENDFGLQVLICALFFDLYTDGLNGFRQIAASVKYSITSTLVKKFTQLALILLILKFNQALSLIDYAAAFTIPSLLVFYLDFRRFQFTMRHFQIAFLVRSKKLWFQSGGTSLASFDIPILIAFNALSVIPIFVVSRKISNALGIFGSTLVPHSMRDAAGSHVTTRNMLNNVFSLSFLVFCLCIPIGLFSERILSNVFNLEGSTENLSVFLVVLATIPIGIITSNLNAVLISTNRAGLAAASTYASSSIYLATICIGCILNHPYLALSFAVVLNLLTEYSIQRFFLREELKNE